jgi:hypothetical protein
MIYEIVNPSDKVTFEAPNDKVAIAAVILLADGKFGLVDEEGNDTLLPLLFSNEDQIKAVLVGKGFDDGVKGLAAFIDANVQAVGECLASSAVVSIGDRKALLRALGNSGRKLEDALSDWNEEKRTSLNDICGCAHRIADQLAASMAKGGSE